jgi:hypothetical protein
MVPPKELAEAVLGCELLIPDTAFFANDDGSGRIGNMARDVLSTDPKTGCICQVTNPVKLHISEVRTHFAKVMRERCRDEARRAEPALVDRAKKALSKQRKVAVIARSLSLCNI